MKIHFLGGADEIGASCALLEAGGRRVLVDAGVRMGSSQRDRLPDLARATDLGGIDEVLVTHAHLSLLGPEIEPTRPPSVRTDTRIVTVKVAALPGEEAAARVQRTLEQETGFGVRFEGAATPPPRATYDETGRMEINAALAEVDRVFAGLPHRPHKKSKKRDAEGELIELAFISPEVGARYEAALEDLRYRTSWRIRVADRVDQQAVLRLARELIPAGWQARDRASTSPAARCGSSCSSPPTRPSAPRSPGSCASAPASSSPERAGPRLDRAPPPGQSGARGRAELRRDFDRLDGSPVRQDRDLLFFESHTS
jgi:hypothetical protein